MIAISKSKNVDVINDIERFLGNLKSASYRDRHVKITVKKALKKSRIHHVAKIADTVQDKKIENSAVYRFVSPVVKLAVNISFFLKKGFFLYSSSSSLLNKLNTYIDVNHTVFLSVTEREKEDILIRWTHLAKVLNEKIAEKPTFVPLSMRPTYVKLERMIFIVNEHVKKMDTELYGERTYSQERLKELASKISHLPDDMLEDLVSDDY